MNLYRLDKLDIQQLDLLRRCAKCVSKDDCRPILGHVKVTRLSDFWYVEATDTHRLIIARFKIDEKTDVDSLPPDGLYTLKVTTKFAEFISGMEGAFPDSYRVIPFEGKPFTYMPKDENPLHYAFQSEIPVHGEEGFMQPLKFRGDKAMHIEHSCKRLTFLKPVAVNYEYTMTMPDGLYWQADERYPLATRVRNGSCDYIAILMPMALENF